MPVPTFVPRHIRFVGGKGFRLSRAGELTAVSVLDKRHEAMRDLSRARQAAKKDLQGKRHQISSR